MSPLKISLAKDILVQAQLKVSSVLPLNSGTPIAIVSPAAGERLLSRHGSRIPSDLPDRWP